MTRDTSDPLLDTKEGVQRLFDWAKAHGFVLHEFHEKLAKKHKVPTDGVVISRADIGI